MKQVFSSNDWNKSPKKSLAKRMENFFARTGRKVRNLQRKYSPSRSAIGDRKTDYTHSELSEMINPRNAQIHGAHITVQETPSKSPVTHYKMKLQNYFSRKKRSGKNRPNRNRKGVKKWALLCLKALGILAVLGIIFLIGIFIFFSKDLPEVGNVNSRFVAESTKIYDRSGKVLLYDIHGEEKRTIIPGSDIPQTIKHATIALEDHDFYNHHGVNFKAIARAVLSQFGFGTRSGGSTITQQLIKNSILTSERSITRKIKEAILAIELEFTTDKEDILGLYLNEIPYGSNAYGIEAAAQTFFEKNARDLTYDEAAILASLPQAPSRYSPYGLNQELLKGRQERAIDEMATLGFITTQQATQFKEVDVLAKVVKNRENINAPHFVFYVRDYLEQKYGADYLEKNGLTIITTLDWEKQQIAQRIVGEKARENKEKYNAENASLVAIDPKTGEILTMVGSRDYFDEEIDGQVNVALSKRQPGSSFKPYVYLQSFIEGYTPETILFDVETAFPTDRAADYEPQNYDGKFRGPVKIKEALGLSLNIPAVKALYLVGLDDVLTFTQSLGITTLTNPERYGLSLVLGGGEVTLLDHTAAFSVLANKGEKYEKQSIIEVRDRDGVIIEKNDNTQPERIVEEEYVNMLSHALSTNKYREPAFGANNPLRFDDRPVAAKTGTTNENRDAWTMGYTPEVAIGVWAGNNDNSSMNSRGVGANAAAPIFRAFLLESYIQKGDDAFGEYDKDDVKTNKDILDGDIPDVEKIDVCEISDDEYCRQNKYCPDSKKKERAFVNIHNILHFVSKDDPRGEEPKNPKDDPFYKKWEEGIEDFYKDQDDVVFDDEPRECRSDDFEDLKPKLSLSLELSGNELEIKADEDAPFDVERFTYYVNDQEVASFEGDRYKHTIPEDLNNTILKIRVKLKDELGNETDAQDEIFVSF